ncbi:hypothetical protein [Desulfotruncus arcticus]|uniref:hypothetical protein n=1 Tax=Desulfotruncus arcticus TaxID=341036 RepID=UPI0013F4E728|nr:hypothetical protein [Desulfotruncus arcticus]
MKNEALPEKLWVFNLVSSGLKLVLIGVKGDLKDKIEPNLLQIVGKTKILF